MSLLGQLVVNHPVAGTISAGRAHFPPVPLPAWKAKVEFMGKCFLYLTHHNMHLHLKHSFYCSCQQDQRISVGFLFSFVPCPFTIAPPSPLPHWSALFCARHTHICAQSNTAGGNMHQVGLQTTDRQEEETSYSHSLQFRASLYWCRAHPCTMDSPLLLYMQLFRTFRDIGHLGGLSTTTSTVHSHVLVEYYSRTLPHIATEGGGSQTQFCGPQHGCFHTSSVPRLSTQEP